MSKRALSPRIIARSALTRRLRTGLLAPATLLTPTGVAQGKVKANLSAASVAQGKVVKASFTEVFSASGKAQGKVTKRA